MNKVKRKPGNTSVARILAHLMDKHEIDEIKDLADRAGMHQPTLYRIYTGEIKDPKTQTLAPLAAYFQVEVAELRGEKPLVHDSKARLSPTAMEVARIITDLPKETQQLIRSFVMQLAAMNPAALSLMLTGQGDNQRVAANSKRSELPKKRSSHH